MEIPTLLRKERINQELCRAIRSDRDTPFASRRRDVITNWNPKRIGWGIAAVALLFCTLVGRQKPGVWATERNADNQPFLSARALPKPSETATVPAGTRIHIRLRDAISTEKNSSGDHFTASLDGPLVVGIQLLSPSRNKIIGQLTEVVEPARVKEPTRLTMVLNELIVNGKRYMLETRPLTLISQRTEKNDSEVIAPGTAPGAAAFDARIGAGSGAGYAVTPAGGPIAYGPSSQFTFTLSAPVNLPVIRKMGGMHGAVAPTPRRETKVATEITDSIAGNINIH